MSNNATLIVIGKLKDKSLEQIEEGYLKRIKSPSLKIIELKAKAEDKVAEGSLILQKIQELSKNGSSFIVALTENGKQYDSHTFSSWVFDKITQNQNVFFLIAGAEGFSEQVLGQVQMQLSLSKLTFPHKLARILFIEQFYRAITIKNNHPYHN